MINPYFPYPRIVFSLQELAGFFPFLFYFFSKKHDPRPLFSLLMPHPIRRRAVFFSITIPFPSLTGFAGPKAEVTL